MQNRKLGFRIGGWAIIVAAVSALTAVAGEKETKPKSQEETVEVSQWTDSNGHTVEVWKDGRVVGKAVAGRATGVVREENITTRVSRSGNVIVHRDATEQPNQKRMRITIWCEPDDTMDAGASEDVTKRHALQQKEMESIRKRREKAFRASGLKGEALKKALDAHLDRARIIDAIQSIPGIKIYSVEASPAGPGGGKPRLPLHVGVMSDLDSSVDFFKIEGDEDEAPGHKPTMIISKGEGFALSAKAGSCPDMAVAPLGLHRIGVVCAPADDVLRDQLELEDPCLVVKHVVKNLPAEKAGLRPHDILITADKQELNNVGDLTSAVDKAGEEDRTMSLSIMRKGKRKTVEVKPTRRTAPKNAMIVVKSHGASFTADPSRLIPRVGVVGPGYITPRPSHANLPEMKSLAEAIERLSAEVKKLSEKVEQLNKEKK